jgi:hypothetical protein
MSVLRNPVQPLALTTQAGLIRLLLECRFDFQHKIWSVPRFEPRSGDGLSSALDRDALLPLLSAVISDFSDPAPGVEKSPRPPFRRMGIRSGRFSGKLKTNKEK